MSFLELQQYFESVELPKEPIQVNSYTKIIDPAKFVSSHIEILKANSGKKTFLPYWERLVEFQRIIENRGKASI